MIQYRGRNIHLETSLGDDGLFTLHHPDGDSVRELRVILNSEDVLGAAYVIDNSKDVLVGYFIPRDWSEETVGRIYDRLAEWCYTSPLTLDFALRLLRNKNSVRMGCKRFKLKLETLKLAAAMSEGRIN